MTQRGGWPRPSDNHAQRVGNLKREVRVHSMQKTQRPELPLGESWVCSQK